MAGVLVAGCGGRCSGGRQGGEGDAIVVGGEEVNALVMVGLMGGESGESCGWEE